MTRGAAGVHSRGRHQARVATRGCAATCGPSVRSSMSPGPRDSATISAGWVASSGGFEMQRSCVTVCAPRPGRCPGRPAPALAVVAPLGTQVGSARRHLVNAMNTERYYRRDRSRWWRRPSSRRCSPSCRIARARGGPGLVRKPWRSLSRARSPPAAIVPDEQLHDLRIRAKRCRYAAERRPRRPARMPRSSRGRSRPSRRCSGSCTTRCGRGVAA